MERITLTPRGVSLDGRDISLTPTERTLLGWLLAHRGQPQPRDTLLEQVWGYRKGVDSRTVDMAIRRLREKLEPDPERPSLIKTVRGLGYLLESRSPRPKLIGRCAEIERIERWIDDGGPLLLVTGPPGIGKSCIVEHALGGKGAYIDCSSGSLAWALEALERARGLVWLDNADPLLDRLLSALPGPRRAVITCRYPVDHPLIEHLIIGPLPPEGAQALLDSALAERFPLAKLAPDARQAILRAAEGNPSLLRLSLWDRLGADLAGLPERHRSREAQLGWGCDSLEPEDRSALQMFAAVDAALSEDAAAALLGEPDTRRRLARLRERFVLAESAPGQFEAVPEVRAKLGSAADPERLEALRRWVAERAEEMGGAGREDRSIGWELLAWASHRSSCPADLALIAVAMDNRSSGSGMRYDARPWLERAMAVPQPPFARQILLGRCVFAAYRAGESAPALSSELDAEIERSEDPHTLTLGFRHLYARLWSGQILEAKRAAARLIERTARVRDHYLGSLCRVAVGQALGAEGRHREALAALKAAAALNAIAAPHKSWEVGLHLAEAMLDVGDVEEAEEQLIAVQQDPEPSDAFEPTLSGWRAWLSFVRTGSSPSLDTLKRSIQTLEEANDPRAPPLLQKLVLSELALGRPDRALPGAVALVQASRGCNALMSVWTRPMLAATQHALGLTVSDDDLPPTIPDTDPVLEALTRYFVARSRGESGERVPEPETGLVARQLWSLSAPTTISMAKSRTRGSLARAPRRLQISRLREQSG